MRPHCFQVPNAALLQTSEVMLHCLGHIRTVLCCDMQVCLPQENRKMWIKWARIRSSGASRRKEELQEIAEFLGIG